MTRSRGKNTNRRQPGHCFAPPCTSRQEGVFWKMITKAGKKMGMWAFHALKSKMSSDWQILLFHIQLIQYVAAKIKCRNKKGS